MKLFDAPLSLSNDRESCERRKGSSAHSSQQNHIKSCVSHVLCTKRIIDKTLKANKYNVRGNEVWESFIIDIFSASLECREEGIPLSMSFVSANAFPMASYSTQFALCRRNCL